MLFSVPILVTKYCEAPEVYLGVTTFCLALLVLFEKVSQAAANPLSCSYSRNEVL